MPYIILFVGGGIGYFMDIKGVQCKPIYYVVGVIAGVLVMAIDA